MLRSNQLLVIYNRIITGIDCLTSTALTDRMQYAIQHNSFLFKVKLASGQPCDKISGWREDNPDVQLEVRGRAKSAIRQTIKRKTFKNGVIWIWILDNYLVYVAKLACWNTLNGVKISL